MSDGDSKGAIDTVQVALRIRPLMQQEIERGCDECIDVVNGHPQVQIKDYAFTYNYVFPQHITQQEFYDTAVKGLIGKLFQGYNVTILAYGQTGSGKTYTMGTNYSGSDGDSTKLGVIPQAVADIFDFIETHEDKFIFKVTVSFMELYQEQCYDLLSGKERSHSIIEIREDINKGVVLPGITELRVKSTMETMMVLEQGSAGRVTGSTAMNQASSRSHAVFTIVIFKESRSDKNIATTSKFHLVDLAGSERIKKTKASGERLKEGVKINQGLLALGNVISALGDGTNRSFIGYRDSKLTRLLQDSLGGNSLTLMVACVSPADYNLDETVSTLRYADRARRIRNKPIINQDARAAEITRLNNLVNELRLQLVGKAPTAIEQNNEQLQEELEREKARYQELLKKHKQVTEHLNNMLIENTNLCEKALLAEVAKEKLELKLNELTEMCNQTIESLSTSEKVYNETRKSNVMDYFKEIKSRLEDLQTANMKNMEELLDHDIKVSFVKDDCDAAEKIDEEALLNEDQTVIEEEKRTMEQVALNQELQNLNRAMAIKASVVQAILANNKVMLDGQLNLRENEEKIVQLERERDELMQQLKQTKSKDPSHEERRTKVSTLEAQIADLKKKCQQQANIIKMKEKNEAKIAALNAELQAMKVTKVKIIKQMREESEKFRKWKADNERALLRLRNEDRKRATAMARMESLHTKQKTVLKRKMEEAVAVNKRLKEALERQKTSAMKRSAKGNMKAGAVQQYIEQELEVHLSIVEAEKSLEELMEYRAWIKEEIETLRNSSEDEESRKKLAELEDDLALRKAQISDLQQKILNADQENKARTQWDNIQSMIEAKVALKCLFEMLVDAKRELQSQSEKGYQARYEEVKEANERLVVEYENSKAEFERQLNLVKVQSEQKIADLVELHRGVGGRGEACQHLQNVIQYQQERLDQLDDENKKLMEELEQLRAASNNNKKRPKKKTEEDQKVEYVDLTEDEEDDYEDQDKDPDWMATPLFKRIQAQRSRLTITMTQDDSNVNRAPKRGSDGAVSCTCRGSCSTKMCGCVKAGSDCRSTCRCQTAMCRNRHDKENQPSSEDSLINTTPPAYFEERQFDATFVKRKKKKSYFFPIDQENNDSNTNKKISDSNTNKPLQKSNGKAKKVTFQLPVASDSEKDDCADLNAKCSTKTYIYPNLTSLRLPRGKPWSQTYAAKKKTEKRKKKKLMEELEQLRAASNNNKKRPKKKTEENQKVVYVDLTVDEEDDYEDQDKDPDCMAMPLFKRIQAQRSRLTITMTQDDSNVNRAPKRGSDGAVSCTCRGSCSTKMCGCVKAGSDCRSTCRCQTAMCRNRHDKENQPSSEDSLINTTPPAYFEERQFDATFVKRKKKKSYFFPIDQENSDSNTNKKISDSNTNKPLQKSNGKAKKVTFQLPVASDSEKDDCADLNAKCSTKTYIYPNLTSLRLPGGKPWSLTYAAKKKTEKRKKTE